MNYVILGGGYAGVIAAIRLARRSRGRARVTLVNASDRFVERIRLHERGAGRVSSARTLTSILGGTGVELVIGCALAVDEAAQTVTVGHIDATNSVAERRLSWDRLVLALGSRPETTFPGVREHAHALDGPGAETLAARLPELAAKSAVARTRGRVLVVGGGLTGIEVASEIAESWPELQVELLTQGEVGAGFSDAARRHFAEAFARFGIQVHTYTSAVRVEEGRVVTTDDPVPFDVCIWTSGLVGGSLPSGLGVATNERGQVLVDPCLRSVTNPSIYVAGDLAAHAAPPPIPVPMGCKSAGPAGAHVADNLVRELFDRPLVPFDFVAPLYCVSLGRRDGVVQRTRPDGSLDGPVLRGRLGAWVKELICKSTLTAFTLERFGLSRYEMFRGGNLPALPSAAAARMLATANDARGTLDPEVLGS
jgi:NADH dehydrogenase FAD-containing subunit